MGKTYKDIRRKNKEIWIKKIKKLEEKKYAK
jgi:hypothetical protein